MLHSALLTSFGTLVTSCDTLTLAWAIRPTVGGKDKAVESLQQHYKSFFKAYIADQADHVNDRMQGKRKAAVDEIIKALGNAKKDDWDAVIFQVHQQLGSLDIDK